MEKSLRLDFSYGKRRVQVSIPELSLIKSLELPEIHPHVQPKAAVINALKYPIKSPKLRDIAIGKDNAVVMIPDRTRPIPLSIILPPVLNELSIAGIPKEKIKIVIGLGAHRPMSLEEIYASVRKEMVKQYEIVNHTWWKPDQLKDIGYIYLKRYSH